MAIYGLDLDNESYDFYNPEDFERDRDIQTIEQFTASCQEGIYSDDGWGIGLDENQKEIFSDIKWDETNYLLLLTYPEIKYIEWFSK